MLNLHFFFWNFRYRLHRKNYFHFHIQRITYITLYYAYLNKTNCVNMYLCILTVILIILLRIIFNFCKKINLFMHRLNSLFLYSRLTKIKIITLYMPYHICLYITLYIQKTLKLMIFYNLCYKKSYDIIM